MINKGVKGSFPSQAVSDLEKMTIEYGSQVGRAIEHEWFSNTTGSSMYMNNRMQPFGEQSVL